VNGFPVAKEFLIGQMWFLGNAVNNFDRDAMRAETQFGCVSAVIGIG
jgi:hypothetical protein